MRSAPLRMNGAGRSAAALSVFAVSCAILWLFSRSDSEVEVPHVARPPTRSAIKIAIYDLRGTGHEEVLAPVLYGLAQMPHVTTTVFRQTYKPGFHELVAPYYAHPYLANDDLLGTSADGNRTLANFDILILLTAEIDLPVILSHVRLENYPRLRIISIVHRVSPWSLTPDAADGYWLDHAVLESIKAHHKEARLDQLCFMTLSPHMEKAFAALLKSERAVDHSCIGTFVPVSSSHSSSSGR